MTLAINSPHRASAAQSLMVIDINLIIEPSLFDNFNKLLKKIFEINNNSSIYQSMYLSLIRLHNKNAISSCEIN